MHYHHRGRTGGGGGNCGSEAAHRPRAGSPGYACHDGRERISGLKERGFGRGKNPGTKKRAEATPDTKIAPFSEPRASNEIVLPAACRAGECHIIVIPMDCSCIPFTQIPQASRLFTDYLYDFARVSPFFRFDPFQQESFFKAAQSLRYEDALRRQVVAALREQNHALAAGEKTFENLEKLEQPDCYAVVTGQQV